MRILKSMKAFWFMLITTMIISYVVQHAFADSYAAPHVKNFSVEDKNLLIDVENIFANKSFSAFMFQITCDDTKRKIAWAIPGVKIGGFWNFIKTLPLDEPLKPSETRQLVVSKDFLAVDDLSSCRELGIIGAKVK